MGKAAVAPPFRPHGVPAPDNSNGEDANEQMEAEGEAQEGAEHLHIPISGHVAW